MRKLILFCTSAILSACTSDAPSEPMCRIDQKHYENVSSNAGCIVRVGDYLLSLTNRKSSRFDIPGGNMIVGESAQCTAHRETWEETGFNVEVGKYLGTSPKGFRFYACELDDDFGGKVQNFPVPTWAQVEVSSIQLVDPFITSPKEWRFPDQLVQIRDMFNNVAEENSAQIEAMTEEKSN